MYAVKNKNYSKVMSESTSLLNSDIKKVIDKSKLNKHTKLSLLVCLKYELYSDQEILDYIFLANQLHSITPNIYKYKVVN